MTAPIISIVVPTWNRPQLLRRTLASIRAQVGIDVDAIEVIVVDDAGEDPADIVSDARSYGMNIQLIRHPYNRGRAATKNTGIHAATTDWTCFLDDDDVLYPSHVATLMSAASKYGLKTVPYVDANRCIEDADGTDLQSAPHQQPAAFHRAKLMVANFIPILCPVTSTALLVELGGFDESLEVLEDWDLWLRVSAHADMHRIGEITCEYRHRVGLENSVTREIAQHMSTLPVIYGRHPVDRSTGIGRAIDDLRLARIDEHRQSLQTAHHFARSVLLISPEQPEALLEQLAQVVDVQEPQSGAWEIVVHAPSTPEIHAIRDMLDGDVTFVWADPEQHVTSDDAMKILQRRAVGKLLVGTDGIPFAA